MKIIAHIENDFKEKFGIPRQSGIASAMVSRIVFEREYRNPDALRGIDGYSHLWLIWKFSESERDEWSPTVRPPRLGGNRRMGVFATRSPFRPNPIGLSSVRLVGIEDTERGKVLLVSGADLLDGTPIYDIKPYLPHIDSIPDAMGGFSTEIEDYTKDVFIPVEQERKLPKALLLCLKEILAQDPRPSYIEDNNRMFGFEFDKYEIKFKVDGRCLTVISIDEK